MSAIEQVIARARSGDAGFSERKQFKLARRRAIEKLRRFALADPYFYILELIQAAIAGGADYVYIACGDGDVLVSWTGGHLKEDELAQLFDFLFASKERLDIAHVRSLALGVNALMLFEPESVTIESGDGSPGGTARMVVRRGADQVDVGKAEGRLKGTYVRATKLNRSKVAAETGRRGDDSGSLEFATVELRCLAAPVPLVFNGQPLFGWSRQRIPNLFGYKQVRDFDEGDLYGVIGLDPLGGEPSFQVMTHGVWVQSYQHDLIRGKRLGGIVCFDRLHKTVDHSGFVRDDRFEEMWLRLMPYAERLVGGKSEEAPQILGAGGFAFSPNELRDFLHEHPRVVVIPPEHEPDSAIGKQALTLARSLDAELLRVPDSQVAAVRVLGGRGVVIWRPRVEDREELRFYGQPALEAPAEPWLLRPTELDGFSVDKLVDAVMSTGPLLPEEDPDKPPTREQRREVCSHWGDFLERLHGDDPDYEAPASARPAQEQAKAAIRRMFGETGEAKATLYTPAEPGRAARGLLIRVTTCGRQLGTRLFASAYPGRVLDVELPTASPSLMKGAADGVGFVAGYLSSLSVPVLRDQDQRALTGLSVGKIEPNTAAARVALQVLSRVTVTRLRAARPGRMAPGLSFSLLRPVTGFDPFSLPLLRTVSGQDLSLRALALLSDQCGGLVYGTTPEVPADLEGLDLDRVLALDAGSERTLIGLLGESGYVRVDARDVLTQHEGLLVRDVALGLREYPDFPVLVEGDTSALDGALDDARGGELLERLVDGLEARVLGKLDEDGQDPRELEEHRRQAVRHLQWIACRKLAGGKGEVAEEHGLLDFPLFIDLDGELWSLRQVLAALRSPAGLLVHYGHVFGSAELGAITEAVSAGWQPGEGGPSSIAASAFVYRLLVPLGRVRLAFDFDLDDVEAEHNPMTADQAFLVRESFEADWGTGVIGIPATRLPEYRVQLRARGRGAVGALDEVAHLYGIVGSIEVELDDWDEDTAERVLQELDGWAQTLLEELIAALPDFADDRRRREAALRVLLTYAGEQLTLIGDEDRLEATLRTPLATRILGLPLFDIGAATLVSGQRLLASFRRHFEGGGAQQAARFDWQAELAEDTPKLVFDWLDAHLQPARVVLPASAGHSAVTPESWHPRGERKPWPAGARLGLEALAWNIEHWLERLRPDPRDGGRRPLPPTRVWIATHELHSGQLVEGGDMRVDIDGSHAIVERLIADPSPSNFAWLLLAVYAHLNMVCGPILNSHEASFQRVIAEVLASGDLRVLEPHPEDLVQADDDG